MAKKKTRAQQLADDQARLASEAAAIQAMNTGMLTDAQIAAPVATPTPAPEQTSMALTPDQARALESDIVRAISGGTEQEVTQTLQRIQQTARPASAPVVTEEVTEEVIEDKNVGGKPLVASDGTQFSDTQSYVEYQAFLDGKRERRQSAFDLLYEEFSRYGLGSLVETLRGLITDSTVSPSEFAIRLRQSEPYKQRFAANSARITKGLRALTEAEYLELEDQYQDIMRRYGLPETYYTRGELGRQQGFEDLLGFDVSPRELEERIATAQDRVKNAPPEVLESIKSYYGDTIRDGDVLAYVLDPKNAVDAIKRKVAAAEIGAGARQAGLGLGRTRAEELGAFGVTGEQARAGFSQIAGGLERGTQLGAIYQAPYGQEVAEQEIFGISGAPEARKRRQRIIKSEEAAFGGQTGLTGGALSRERAGQI